MDLNIDIHEASFSNSNNTWILERKPLYTQEVHRYNNIQIILVKNYVEFTHFTSKCIGFEKVHRFCTLL